MKTALYGVMLSALLVAGCIEKTPFTWPEAETATSQAVPPPARKHLAAVRADQVTAENAHEKAQQLEEELENDSSEALR
jgi:hypothetical protein